MEGITYVDRKTGQKKIEKIYGHVFIELLYGDRGLARIFSFLLLPCFARLNFLSRLYGAFQKSALSQKKIVPFIEKFKVDTTEFLESVESYQSFNDFFIRRLKPSARPIDKDEKRAVLPADARYLVYQDISKEEGFWVKGHKFSIAELVQDPELASRYERGGMVIARLCPVDYHRFHFPVSCMPSLPRLINGPLFSVNPIALRKSIHYLSENKRVITELDTESFGKVLFIEVGATYVGSIHQTFELGKWQEKGAEKGYFSFGGSCVILLFEEDKIVFDSDLVQNSAHRIETLGLLGQSLGHS